MLGAGRTDVAAQHGMRDAGVLCNAQVLKQASATSKDKPVPSGLLRVKEATPKKGALFCIGAACMSLMAVLAWQFGITYDLPSCGIHKSSIPCVRPLKPIICQLFA